MAYTRAYILPHCRCGGIGRRTGLKILRPQGHESSILSDGTIKIITKTAHSRKLFFIYFFIERLHFFNQSITLKRGIHFSLLKFFMQTLNFSIHINAPREKVWNTMLNQETYKQWTQPFNPAGSYYEGSWDQGAEIRFLGVSENGSGQGGMFSRIQENRKYEFVSIEHLGVIENGVVDTTSEKVKQWTPSFENYTFADHEGGTLLTVELGIPDEYKEMFEPMWPQSLQILKQLAEK